MADIDIEKKKRPVWPWIVAILLAAAVIWWVADDDDEYGDEVSTVQTEQQYDDTERERDRTAGEQTAGAGAAMAYVNFIEENGQQVTKSHQYTHKAMTHLSKAVEAIAQENNVAIENKQELNNLKEKADQLKEERSSTKHANIMAEAFTSAAKVINNIQDKQYPDLKQPASEVMNAAKDVKPDVLATNQKSEIKNFFDKSASAIEEMHSNSSVSMK